MVQHNGWDKVSPSKRHCLPPCHWTCTTASVDFTRSRQSGMCRIICLVTREFGPMKASLSPCMSARPCGMRARVCVCCKTLKDEGEKERKVLTMSDQLGLVKRHTGRDCKLVKPGRPTSLVLFLYFLPSENLWSVHAKGKQLSCIKKSIHEDTATLKTFILTHKPTTFRQHQTHCFSFPVFYFIIH